MAGYDGYGAVPIDFSGIGQLGDIYQKNKQQAVRQQSLAALGQGAPPEEVAQALFRAGDVEGGTSLARLAEARAHRIEAQGNNARDFAFRQEEAKRTQGNADRLYNATMEGQRVPAGFTRDPDGSLKPVPGGPADPGYIKQAAEAKIGSGLLDQDTIGQMAEQYRAGDTSVLTNLGRGAQGAENIKLLRQEIVRQNTAGGISGTEQAAKNAEYFGTKAGQRTLGTKQANIELAATEFKQVIPVVAEASKAVNRTEYPDLNKIIQAFNEKTGDPNIVKFGGGINTLVNLYARAISPSGVGTVSDKEHAREILQKSWSQGQFDAAVGMMQQEIDAALASPEKVRDDMRKRFLGGAGSVTSSTEPKAETPKAAPATAPTYPTVKNRDDAGAAVNAAKAALKTLIDSGTEPQAALKAVNERLRKMGAPPLSGP
jgi:hypothetical protein